MHRRKLLQAIAPLLAMGSFGARAQQRVPIADMHSHYGMITRKLSDSGLADDMRSQRVALVAWKLVADSKWIRSTDTGIEQFAEPAKGDLAALFNEQLARMRAYVEAHKLRPVLTRADVDACVSGEPGIVFASEGADFLEGQIENLDAAYEKGLRHLQLVHYIRTPVGDLQTSAPTHKGLSDLGKSLVEACNAKGILVDLAHSTEPAIDQALEIARAPVVWSHGWVDFWGGNWRERYGFQKRRLSTSYAKKIASRGGVVGLWGLGLGTPGGGWSVGAKDTHAYARELAKLVDKIGADHVAFGTDIEGVGPNWAVNDYSHVRRVIEHLQEMKLGTDVIEKIAYGNHARVLKAALKP